jgi:glycylpeptide N-tetradecanoyltransferase
MSGKGKDNMTEEQKQALKKSLQSFINQLSLQEAEPEPEKPAFKFWKTQPVPAIDEEVKEDGPIEADTPYDQIQKEEYPLPASFTWCNVNIDDEKELNELYTLLTENYVEDDDALFRFDYSSDFLKWALQPPGWKPQWLLGVRVKSNNKLVAFISGIPATLRIHTHEQYLVEINFLCVHKKLRSKRLAPVLIKEVTRRIHLQGIFQALYTAGVHLPKPISVCRYYHRSLNPKKLIEVQFSHLRRNKTMAQTIKYFRLPEKPLIPGFREMKKEDIDAVQKLLNNYLNKFEVAPVFSREDVEHWLIPRDEVIFSYVVEKDNEITDFISFYNLPSSIIGNPKYKEIKAAYLFYYCPEGNGSKYSANRALINDALIMAKSRGFDVFNCLNLMDNDDVLDDLKFGKGDGLLNYYLYNYRCVEVKPKKLGVVLL